MALVKITELLKKSQGSDFLIGAIECWNYESAIAIISAAEIINSPVVLFASNPGINLLGIRNLVRIMLDLAENSEVKVACHLESVNETDILLQGIKYGLKSVIYDGSELPFDENVKRTASLVKAAHDAGAEVEAQLGSMPFSLSGTGYESIDFSKHKTGLEEAKYFVENTGIDILAPNLGNVHGLYKQKIHDLDLALANSLVEKVCLPVTLHGGTGIPDELIEEAKKSKLSMMYIATSIFENFRVCIKNNIDKKSGYGSICDISIICRDNLIDYVTGRLKQLGSLRFENKSMFLSDKYINNLANIISAELKERKLI
jgi:fructose-bisphosphate aldolase class II